MLWVAVAIALTFTIYLGFVAPNPYEQGSQERSALRSYRAGVVLFWWAIVLGVIGAVLVPAIVVLGAMAIGNGRRGGAGLIVAGLAAPFLSVALLGW